MRKIIMASVLTFFLLVAFGPVASAEMPKQGTSSGTMSYSGTHKIMLLGKERVQMNYEVMGVYVGEGPLNNSSFRCIGGLHAVKGTFNNDCGSCVYVTPNGDQAFGTYEAKGKVGGSAKGTYTWVGGTGKLAGLSGGGELIRINVRPITKGTFQGYSKVKGHWKLP